MKIGKRVLKTGLAVIITLSIYLVLMLLDKILGLDRNTNMFAPTNWYTPFFGAIATVYAMQNNPKGSISQAKIRSFGSIIGGCFGAIIIYIFEIIYIKIANVNSVDEINNLLLFKIIEFIITSLGILILIPLTVKLKWPQASFISCLTYLSVTISIRNGGMNVLFFAFNRILSTIIGVLISLYINTFPHFKAKNKEILFLSSLDNALLNEDKKLSNFAKYKINDLVDHNMNLAFMTTRALTSLSHIFKDVNLKDNIIVMNGAAIYNPINKSYSSLINIDKEYRYKIEDILNKYDVDYFTYLLNNELLNCYYNHLSEEASLKYYSERKDGAFYVFSEAITPSHLSTALYVLVNKKEVIDNIVKDLYKNHIDERCNIIVYPYILDGYSYLKINSKDASKENSIDMLYDTNKYKYLFVVGSGNTDINAMKKADFSMCLNNAPIYVKKEADYILDSSNPEDLLRFMDYVYRKKNYKNYLDSLKITKK